MKRYRNDGFVETVGPYTVAYTQVAMHDEPQRWVWGAILNPDRCPIQQLPARKHGKGDSLPEARNDAREALPTFGSAAITGIDHTQVTEM